MKNDFIKKLSSVVDKYEKEGSKFLQASKDPIFRTKEERLRYLGYAAALSAITSDIRDLIAKEH